MDSTAVDMSSFSLGLDTPSKLFTTGPTGLTPASWSLGGTGLTPSILGGFSSSGWTPSLTSMAGARSELNPFELSLSANSPSSSSTSKRKTGIDFLDREDVAEVSGSPGGSSMFDLLATTPSAGTGRKRALSSPAVEVGCGSSSFPFLSQPSHFHPGSTLSSGGAGSSSGAGSVQRAKRPRMASMQSSALTTAEPFFSSFERESDESPPSSVVLTPPDSAPLYSGGLAANEGRPTGSRDISVIPLSGPSKSALTASAGPPAPALAQSTNLLSRLAQERSALIAAGAGIAHAQTQPLPIPTKRSSASGGADPAAADISVKAEPIDERPSTAASASPTSRPPPVTRGQSKRGTRSSLAAATAVPPAQQAPTVYTSFSFGNSTAGDASPTASGSSKRKAPRRKSTAGRKKGDKEKSASVSAQDGEEDGEDGGGEGDDSNKRQQFLERNRVAACKSRQKKKEKVAGLEQFAADLCARNHMLQQTALALRQEAIALRQLVHAHMGCSCEHAQGYIARDVAGGGIATIDQLAGRVLTLDYSIPPAMGTEDDVYSFLDRNGDGETLARMPASPTSRRSGAQDLAFGSAPGPAIPIVAARPAAPAPAPAPAGTVTPSAEGSSASPVRRTGMMTRRSSLAVHAAVAAAAAMGAEAGPELLNGGGDDDAAAFRAAVASNHLGLAMTTMDATGGGPVPLRATSAPPTTPGWGDAAPMGDYFAPKRSSTRASIAVA